MKITPQQRNFFHAFGFLVLRRHLSPAEMSRTRVEFDAAMCGLREASRPDLRIVDHPNRFLMDGDAPSIVSLAGDERFAGVAELLLARPALCVQVVGHYFIGDTEWHTDNAGLGYEGVKFAVYLDPLHAGNGALRVLPGSHRNPLWQEAGLTHDTNAVFGVRPDRLPAYVFETRPGDALAFAHPLWHASFHGGPYRRMLELNYYADPVTPAERNAFRTQMHANHGPSAILGRQMYPAHWRSIRNTRHRRWIRRLRELNLLETPRY